MRSAAQSDGAWRARSGCAALLALVVLLPAGASTPAAWKEFSAEVLHACLAASTLRNPLAAGERVDFDDEVGFSALLLTGHYRQPHMKNQRGQELCLFDRRSRTATVAPADELRHARHAPAADPQ